MAEELTTPGQRPSWRTMLDVAATLAMLVTAGVLLWVLLRPGPAANVATSRREIPVPTEPLSLEGAPRLGLDTAPVVMIEFSDSNARSAGGS